MYDIEIKGGNDTEKVLTCESWVPESLSNLSHLWDPLSHSFIRHHNKIHNTPASDCLAKCSLGCTHSYTCRFLSSQGRVNDPTPVLSDTCFTPLSQSEQREENLCRHWNNSGPRSEGITTLDSSECHCSSPLYRLTDSERQAQTDSVESKLKEPIPADLDWRHDQRDWVSFHIVA